MKFELLILAAFLTSIGQAISEKTFENMDGPTYGRQSKWYNISLIMSKTSQMAKPYLTNCTDSIIASLL